MLTLHFYYQNTLQKYKVIFISSKAKHWKKIIEKYKAAIMNIETAL